MQAGLCAVLLSLTLGIAASASAAEIRGVVSDPSGGALQGARVVVRDIATGTELTASTDEQGTYNVTLPSPGTYLVLVTAEGFSNAVRTIVVEAAAGSLDLPVQLDLGVLTTQVTVTTARAERDLRQVPLHVETLQGEALQSVNPLSTGDAIANAISAMPVGNGPFGVRPRLRGLESTRLLILVDGERLNTARTATDRAGTEVGLVSVDAISRIEVVNGAGSLMYGTDALAGTINIITNNPNFTDSRRWLYGVNGYYSSNETGWRGTLSLGATGPTYAFRVQGGLERFGDYTAGKLDSEDTRPLFAAGRLRTADTIDDAFGFGLRAFPDPFNVPFVRVDSLVPNSQAHGSSVNASGLVKIGANRSLRVRYHRRRVEDTGFPDFEEPFFFNAVSLPFSTLDKASVRYEARAVLPWLANLSLTGYYQRQQRLLENRFPVQFPVPTARTLFPISVFRLDVLSQTEQRVWTPGVDAQAVIVPARDHLLTAGVSWYRDRSSDRRRTETTMSSLGQVTVGPFGPQAAVLRPPMQLGPPTVSNPVRVPDARFRDVGVFAQDEWRIRPQVSVIGGLRGDFYAVDVEPTPGYDVGSIVAGAVPPIDPATLPDPAGATYARRALTGDIGLLVRPDGAFSPFVRFGRSYRHPNLEEMLFAGPATVGSVIPNVLVEPERGKNFDLGAKFRAGRLSGGAYFFANNYDDFIAAELVVARTAAGPLAQATNFADVRIHGLEVQADAPIVFRRGVLILSGGTALTRGSITEGTNPLDGSSLADTPADNITPVKVVTNVRFSDVRGRWWLEYGMRAQARVDRVALTVLDSPFLIAQDLLSLDSFAVHRLGWGLDLARGSQQAAISFAVENLTDKYYREHFQFAPARGRSFTVGLHVGAF
jgi:hemoglobin/transferrin/lactoferrin receptor protein